MWSSTQKKKNASGFPGEKHPYLYTATGWKKANFMGPGTHLKERLSRGDEPVSDMDKISLAHDLRYSLASSPSDILQADEKFINKARNSKDYAFNKGLGKAINVKHALEKRTGVIYPTTQDLLANDTNDVSFRTRLNQLEQEGYGDPVAILKKKLQSQIGGMRKTQFNDDPPCERTWAARGVSAGRSTWQRGGACGDESDDDQYGSGQYGGCSTCGGTCQSGSGCSACRGMCGAGSEQVGGFWNFLMQAGIQAAKMALGALAGKAVTTIVDKFAPKMKGSGFIKDLYISHKDFAPAYLRKIKQLAVLLRENPSRIDAITRIVQPIFESVVRSKMQRGKGVFFPQQIPRQIGNGTAFHRHFTSAMRNYI